MNGSEAMRAMVRRKGLDPELAEFFEWVIDQIEEPVTMRLAHEAESAAEIGRRFTTGLSSNAADLSVEFMRRSLDEQLAAHQQRADAVAGPYADEAKRLEDLPGVPAANPTGGETPPLPSRMRLTTPSWCGRTARVVRWTATAAVIVLDDGEGDEIEVPRSAVAAVEVI